MLGEDTEISFHSLRTSVCVHVCVHTQAIMFYRVHRGGWLSYSSFQGTQEATVLHTVAQQETFTKNRLDGDTQPQIICKINIEFPQPVPQIFALCSL